MKRRDFFKSEQFGLAILYVLIDIVFVNFALLVGIGLWYDGTIPGGMPTIISAQTWQWFKYVSLLASVSAVAIYAGFNLYSNLWRYANIDEVIKIILANTCIFVLVFLADHFYLSHLNLIVLPKRLLFMAWLVDNLLFMFSRFGYLFFKRIIIVIGHTISKKAGSKRVMVVGAGYAGYGIVRGIINQNKGYENRLPILVVDDDPRKNNTNIKGIRVVNGTANIIELAERYEIEEIIIAIPTATNTQLRFIMEQCSQTNCMLQMLPPMSDVSEGIQSAIREVKISDLLFREEVTIDVKSVSGYLKGKTVLVTGGGGSIGSELCRQIAKFAPKLLIIFDIYENNASQLLYELKSIYGEDFNAIIRIGSVRDMNALEKLFKQKKPEIIFHAAAHKHVNLMEDCPDEAVKNNIFGTLNVVKCADKYSVERFVLLSSDKAVNPTNVMGATKRVTELIMQNTAKKSATKFMAVRFGNVLGSNGSVIPIFQQQIAAGGPVTVTHKEIVRYFMTIPEAAQLVLQAAGMGKSGRISVLDMGSPIRIYDLAKNLIKLSGFVPNKDIQIVFTGLRQGEKLYEELIMEEEKEDMKVTYQHKIFVTKPIEIDQEEFECQLQNLYAAAYGEASQVNPILKKLVPSFQTEDVVNEMK